MSRNLYNFYSADGTFYPSQKKNVTIENFTSGPQVIETFKGAVPSMYPFRYFKLKTEGQFLKVIEETVTYAKKGTITNYRLIKSDNEFSIFTYDNISKRILTTNVIENFEKPKSIRVTKTGLVIIGVNGGSEFTAEASAGEVPNLRNGDILLNLIDLTGEIENLLEPAIAAVETAQGAFKNAQAAFDTTEGNLTAAETTFNSAQDALNTAQGSFNSAQDALNTAQTAFDNAEDNLNTAQGNLTAAQTALTDAQTALENA